jgi:hypothetical protein
MDPYDLRASYNHHVWPSPRARIVAKNRGCKLKRITHEQALNYLANKCNKTIEEFLSMGRDQSWKALGCVLYNSTGEAELYDPLFGPFNPHANKYRTRYYYNY